MQISTQLMQTRILLGAATPYDGTFVDAEPIPQMTILSIGAEAFGDMMLAES